MASPVQPSVKDGPWTSFMSCFSGHTATSKHDAEVLVGQARRSPGDKDPVAGSTGQSAKTAAVYAATGEQGLDAASNHSDSPTEYAEPAYRQSTDAASTSYPSSCIDGSSACMTSALEMEACVDTVLDGSIKSAQSMFSRYDMNLDRRLNQQDYYDLMLELNLALPIQEYQQFVDNTFCYADADHDCLIAVEDFVPLYKAIAAARQAFKHQDHHHNGLIDRYDFTQVLAELEIDGGKLGLKVLADEAFSLTDSSGRGILNFGQVLLWYGSHLAAVGRQDSQEPSSSQAIPQ